MATEVIDLSALSAALEAPSTPVEANVGIPEVPETKTADTKVEEAEPKVSEETPKETGDKSDKSEAKAEDAPALEAKKPEILAKSIHEALKAFMGEKPTEEGKAKLREINAMTGELYKQVAEARAVSEDIEEVTSSAKALEDLVRSADEMIYRGDPEIVENIYSDVLAQNGDASAFEKLVPAFLDKLKETNPEKYYSDHVAPIYEHALESTGMKDAVRGLISAYNSGDKSALRSGIEAIAKHIEEVGSKVEGHKTAATAKQAEQSQAAYKTSIQDSCEVLGNKALGAALRPILNSTELGTYSRETQLEVAKEMRAELNRRLAGDKLFNSRMQRMYEAKDTEGIKREYQKTVTSISAAATRKAIDTIYPNGLLERASAPKAAPAPAKVVPNTSGKATMVSAKPSSDLIDWNRKGSDVLLISGRAYLKDGRFVQWRKN